MTNLAQTMLFSVSLGKDATCDCGQSAETQYVITTDAKTAKQLAANAKKARAAGERTPEVCCGTCVASRIALRGLFVTEVMKHSPIKWERVTLDVNCEDCEVLIPFGVQAHFHAASSRAICGLCGVKRGWSDSKVASDRVQAFELKETLAALRRRVGIEQLESSVIEGKKELHKIGEGYEDLEAGIAAAVSKLNSFFESLATPQEKLILQDLKSEVTRLQTLAQSIKEEFDARLFFLDKQLQKVSLAHGAASTPENKEVAKH